MATYGWRKGTSIVDGLFEAGHEFEFYQAVRLLENLYTQKTPVGNGVEAKKEVVSFKGKTSLEFPPSEINSISKSINSNEPVELLQNIMSLFGSLGPMPYAHSEILIQRIWKNDTAFRDFIDIFNNRLVSLIYKIRRTRRIGIKNNPAGEDSFQSILFSLIGLNSSDLKNRMNLPDRSLLSYVGIFNDQCRSMCGLETILRDYFNVPLSGKMFQGQWLKLEPSQWSHIGKTGINQLLGKNTVLGFKVWDQGGKFRLVVGPITFNKLKEFLPNGKSYVSFLEIVKLYTRGEFDYDIQFVIKGPEIPELRLGKLTSPRLGWSSWLKTKSSLTEDKQVVISSKY